MLTHVVGLDELRTNGNMVEVGALVSLRKLEEFFQKSLPEFHHILWIFGSPQIRYAGTLAGNIANGSPIADSLPFLFVTGAEVEVAGLKGARRIKVNQLYSGYRKMVLTEDEIIARIHIPMPAESVKLKLYKVSKREHLDISSFTAAISLERKGDKIANAQVAYGQGHLLRRGGQRDQVHAAGLRVAADVPRQHRGVDVVQFDIDHHGAER